MLYSMEIQFSEALVCLKEGICFENFDIEYQVGRSTAVSYVSTWPMTYELNTIS